MRLVAVYVQGYKRFGERARLLVDGDVTALVGPNEAGKSAVLEVLAHLENEEVFPDHTVTRGAPPADDEPVVEVLFRLEERDFAGDYPALAEKPLWLEVRQYRNGRVEPEAKPTVSRSRQLRPQAEKAAQELLEDVRQAVEERSAAEEEAEEEEAEPEPLDRLAEALEQVQGKIDVDEDDLDGDVRSVLQEASDLLDSEEIQLSFERPEGKAEFQAAVGYETSSHMVELADLLNGKRPLFLMVDDPSRDLAGSHPISEIEAGEELPALHNLAAMGGISIQDYINANRTNPGDAKMLEQQASEEITRRLSEAWEQSEEVRVDFEILAGDALAVLVTTSGPGGFREASDRSAGLRAFIALVAAIDNAAAGDRPVVLLLEHPEHDLHIDAQADLIKVLEEQTAAQQVIYTTHSPAALPTDIAANTRAIVPEDPEAAPDRSRIAASFTEDDAGLTPLLLVMGAGSAAFTPARRAVIGEGLTEVYLLPEMFREVSGEARLDFQVAAGGAHMDEEMARQVNSDAAHVAFVVDGDEAGAMAIGTITGAGIDRDRIVIAGGEGSGLTIEDLLDEEIYLEAVNEELRRKRAGVEIAPGDLDGEIGRARSVERFCKEKSVNAPEKPAVARRCLERLRPEPEDDESADRRTLVGEERKDLVRRMYEDLVRILNPG